MKKEERWGSFTNNCCACGSVMTVLMPEIDAYLQVQTNKVPDHAIFEE